LFDTSGASSVEQAALQHSNKEAWRKLEELARGGHPFLSIRDGELFYQEKRMTDRAVAARLTDARNSINERVPVGRS
jgi:hypothetical protein